MGRECKTFSEHFPFAIIPRYLILNHFYSQETLLGKKYLILFYNEYVMIWLCTISKIYEQLQSQEFGIKYYPEAVYVRHYIMQSIILVIYKSYTYTCFLF